MSNPEHLPDIVSMRLHRLTRPVPQKELLEYIHYDHVSILLEASHRLGLFVLLRRTNSESIKFIGWPGFVPKPLACKPKTAKSNASIKLPGGKQVQSLCAGLVVHPRMVGSSAFGGDPYAHARAMSTWRKSWGSKRIPPGFAIQQNEDSGYYGCVMRCGADTRVYPQSRTSAGRRETGNVRTETLEMPGKHGFQVLPNSQIDRHALSTLPQGCSYIHGDYDLYALVHRDRLQDREPRAGTFDGDNHTYGRHWKAFEAFVRSKIGVDMIQHGSQEHFSEHTEDVVDMFCPTPERALWHVCVEGREALRQLYEEVFSGRSTVGT